MHWCVILYTNLLRISVSIVHTDYYTQRDAINTRYIQFFAILPQLQHSFIGSQIIQKKTTSAKIIMQARSWLPNTGPPTDIRQTNKHGATTVQLLCYITSSITLLAESTGNRHPADNYIDWLSGLLINITVPPDTLNPLSPIPVGQPTL